LVNKESKEPQDHREIPAEPQVHRDLQDHKVLLAQRVMLAVMEPLDHRAIQVHKDHKVPLARQAQTD
jgi:hypothetical protein